MSAFDITPPYRMEPTQTYESGTMKPLGYVAGIYDHYGRLFAEGLDARVFASSSAVADAWGGRPLEYARPRADKAFAAWKNGQG